jgi:hypothetical protein
MSAMSAASHGQDQKPSELLNDAVDDVVLPVPLCFSAGPVLTSSGSDGVGISEIAVDAGDVEF